MTDLATRIEQATGPDRVIDAEIWTLIIDLSDPDINEPVFRHIVSRILAGGNDGECPAYTASIDAAMTLVGNDFWLELKGPRKYLNIPSPVPNYWSASVDDWNHEGHAMGWGSTPALALCAAALRAREAKP